MPLLFRHRLHYLGRAGFRQRWRATAYFQTLPLLYCVLNLREDHLQFIINAHGARQVGVPIALISRAFMSILENKTINNINKTSFLALYL